MFCCISFSSLVLILFSSCHESYAVPVTSAKATPTPLSISPSQLWDGNDGPWSSFVFHVGLPPQSVRVLISTTSNQPWVVLPEGCSQCIPTDCPSKRGGIFYTNRSSSWSQNTLSTKGLFTLPVEAQLGVRATGSYGFDQLALDGIPTIKNQVISGITSKDIHTGFLGLHPAATNFSTNAALAPSYLSSLKAQGHIPSLSYGYTAGNRYRPDGALASLTLGGYDSSLIEPNDLVIPVSTSSKNELFVTVSLITMKTNDSSQSLSRGSLMAIIDSTIPYIFLPIEVCQRFEEAFGIAYDEPTGLYLVNDSLHDRLVQQSASVVLTLSNSTEAVMVNITLPYQAFDLMADYPLTSKPTRYFPLKRAFNNNQITLGRTFLQEAYLITDHERSTFSIYQRIWGNNTQQLQTIFPLPSSQTTVSSSPSQTNTKVVIGVSTTIATVLIFALLICLTLSLRRHHPKIKIFLATQTEKYRSPSNSRSPRPRISRPILTPLSSPTPLLLHSPAHLLSVASTPQIGATAHRAREGPLTPVRNTASNLRTQEHAQPEPEELDSQPVSPVSPELDSSPDQPTTSIAFQSLAGRISQPLCLKYQQLYDDIVEEVRGQVYTPPRHQSSGIAANGELEDPFIDPEPAQLQPLVRRDTIRPRTHPHISSQLQMRGSSHPRVSANLHVCTSDARLHHPVILPPEVEIHELPATPGFGQRAGRGERVVEREMAQMYEQITGVERAMIRERQRIRSHALILEERLRDGRSGSSGSSGSVGDGLEVRRFSAIGAGWI